MRTADKLFDVALFKTNVKLFDAASAKVRRSKTELTFHVHSSRRLLATERGLTSGGS